MLLAWLCLKLILTIPAVTSKVTLVLAGCVQSYKVWANFSMGWEAGLAMSPSIKHFHMREAQCLSGEFSGWKRKDAD